MGFNFFDYMVYDMVRDAQKKKQAQREAMEKREEELAEKREQEAWAKVEEQQRQEEELQALQAKAYLHVKCILNETDLPGFVKNVAQLLEDAYHSWYIPWQVTDNVRLAILYAAALVCRFAGTISPQMKDYVGALIADGSADWGCTVEQFESFCTSGPSDHDVFEPVHISSESVGMFWEEIISAISCCRSSYGLSNRVFSSYLRIIHDAAPLEDAASLIDPFLMELEMNLKEHCEKKFETACDLDIWGNTPILEHWQNMCGILEQLDRKMDEMQKGPCDLTQGFHAAAAKNIADIVRTGTLTVDKKVEETAVLFSLLGITEFEARSMLLMDSPKLRTIFREFLEPDPGSGQVTFWAFCMRVGCFTGMVSEITSLQASYAGFLNALVTRLDRQYPDGGYSYDFSRKLGRKLLEEGSEELHALVTPPPEA